MVYFVSLVLQLKHHPFQNMSAGPIEDDFLQSAIVLW